MPEQQTAIHTESIAKHKEQNPFKIATPDIAPCTQSELDESYGWHKLFNQGFANAHEHQAILSDEQQDAENQEDKSETEKLLQLRALLDQDLSDQQFRDQLEQVRKLLPRPFTEMIGQPQTSPHLDIDPVDHTLNALYELDTSQLTPQNRHLARGVLVFHDIGKVDVPDRDHPNRSAELSFHYLQKMNYQPDEIQIMLNHIGRHDMLGELARQDGRNVLNPRDAAFFFTDLEDLHLHYTIARADIQSIPGLQKYTPNLEATYELIRRQLIAETNTIEVSYNQPLPFDEIDPGFYYDVKDKLYEDSLYENKNLSSEISRRRQKWEQLSPREQQVLEQGLVQYALQNDDEFLHIMQIIGREIDRSLVSDLEEKYHCNLDQIRVGVELFNMTYNLWELRWDVSRIKDNPSPNEYELIMRKLKEVQKSANFLSAYNLPATHGAPVENVREIEQDEMLRKSRTDVRHHYEGDGVYVGILGGFTGWQDDERGGKIFDINIDLRDTLPIITTYRRPQPMAVVLSEVLDIQAAPYIDATPHGLVQWYDNHALKDVPVPQWKVNMLSELLQNTTILVTDEQQRPCVIIDTEDPPIVWASLARGLQIRRVVPISETNKLGIDQQTDPNIIRPADKFEWQANQVRRIKGIRADDIPQY